MAVAIGDGASLASELRPGRRRARAAAPRAAPSQGRSARRGLAAALLPAVALGAPCQCYLGEDNPRNQAPQCPEQVRLALAGPGQMLLSWSVWQLGTGTQVEYRELNSSSGKKRLASSNGGRTYSTLQDFNSYLWEPPMGPPTTTQSELVAGPRSKAHIMSATTVEDGDIFGKTKFPDDFRQSPVIHTVVLQALQPGKRYQYKVPLCPWSEFKMPSSWQQPSFPVTWGVTADLGQTNVSNGICRALKNMSPSVVLAAGDLSYADGYVELWDSFGRMLEPLASAIPIMTTPGNHEVAYFEQFASYNARWSMPYEQSGSTSNEYYSVTTGPIHLVSLNSYTRMSNESHQFKWLKADLEKFDRQKTPWLVVMFHAPWYTSNAAHAGEGEQMRALMEPLFYQYGVDVVVSGHVHAYERTAYIHNGALDVCGPVHLTVGDGGNREGPNGATNTIVTEQGYSFDQGSPWSARPAWSAFRQSTFGFGQLAFLDARRARVRWQRVACFDASGSGLAAPNRPLSAPNFGQLLGRNCSTAQVIGETDGGDVDEVVIENHPTRCPGKAQPQTVGLFEDQGQLFESSPPTVAPGALSPLFVAVSLLLVSLSWNLVLSYRLSRIRRPSPLLRAEQGPAE